MGIVNRLVGAYLLLVAAAVGVHWIVTPLYDNNSGDYTVWQILNWFMAASVAIALAVNVRNRIAAGFPDEDTPLTEKRALLNLLFFTSIVLTLWFYWNWFNALFPDNESKLVGEIHLMMWAFVNPLFVLVTGGTGFHAWRAGGRE